MKTYIVSLITDDKPGVVEKLSNLISQHGGNWQASNFCQLAGQFAGIVEFSIEQDKSADIENALTQLNAEGYQLQLAQGQSTKPEQPCSTFEITGNDKVGIVKEIASAIAKFDINVLKLKSHTEAAPHSGGTLFKAKVSVQAPSEEALDLAKDELESIANDLIVDIELS